MKKAFYIIAVAAMVFIAGCKTTKVDDDGYIPWWAQEQQEVK